MIEFTYLPDWRWLLFGGVAVVGILAWSYRGARRVPWSFRLFLLCLRLLALATVLICLLDPHRLEKISHQQPAHLAVLLDDSRSMGLQDVPANRLDFCKQWLGKNLTALPTNTSVSYHTLNASLAPLADLDSASPTGSVTALGDALTELASSPQTEMLSGILLCSDGIGNSGKNSEAAARLCRRRNIPIFTLTAGTTNEVRDIVIENVQVKRAVPNESPTRILLEVRSPGYSNQFVRVQISHQDQVLATKEVRLRGGEQRIEMDFTPHEKGFEIYRVSIPPQPGEWLTSNNRRAFGLEVVEPTIRVLYMEGTPSEWRYLKDAAETDPNIQVTAMCQSYNAADVNYSPSHSGRSESNIAYPVNHATKGFPRTLSELLHYDVVINSDIRKEFFSEEQLQNTVRLVEEFGGGFAMVGGYSAFGSGGYQRTIIDRIIPVAMEEFTDYQQAAFQMKFPAGALSHPLMALGGSAEETQKIWNEKLPKLYGYNRVDRAKPGAIVLGENPAAGSRDGPMIILAGQELGKGRTLAFTSDTTRGWGKDFETIWGEPINPAAPLTERNCDSRYYRQFWINTIRWLAAGRMGRTNNPVTLELTKSYCQPDETVTATVQLRGNENREIQGAEVAINWADDSGNQQSAKAEYDSSTHAYAANIRPSAAGNFVLTANAKINGQVLGEDKQVLIAEATDLEMAEVRANPELMGTLASVSNGKTISADDSGGAALVSALQNKAPVTVEYRRTPLWDKSGWLALILGLLSVEWVARRIRGLA